MVFILGALIKETKEAIVEDDERIVSIDHTFHDFNFWALDEPPTGHKLHEALDFITFSSIVSKYV